jgi:hypothetical protein
MSAGGMGEARAAGARGDAAPTIARRATGALPKTAAMVRFAKLLLALATVAFALLTAPTGWAGAQDLSDDGGAEWRVEQPPPPAPAPGVEPSDTPIGLGKIGDVEFWEPNRGALITAGNGTTIKPGVWFYNGAGWRELATVCGAGDGTIAWAGPDEFWTISDGRPGQAVASPSERPPLEDNTLCHFAPGPSGKLEVVGSYAAPAFLSTSYQAMHTAACLAPSDCWFAGAPLPEPQIGTFQLHWNGHALEAEPYLPEGHAAWSMRQFEGSLYEGVRLLSGDAVTKVSRHPPPLHTINGEGAPQLFEALQEVPLYGSGEFFTALDYLHLSADESSLWGAAGPELELPEHSQPAGVTVVRYSKLKCERGASACTDEESPSWSQVLGPETAPTGLERFSTTVENPRGELERVGDVVDSIAADPHTNSAWIALDTMADARQTEPGLDVPALIARLSANGTVSDVEELPASSEPYGPKGAGQVLACPATHDCWLATTHGWLLHLSTPLEHEEEHEEHGHANAHLLTDPVFSSQEPIVVRPADQGLPQVPPDAPPVDDSGLEESLAPIESPGAAAVEENRFAEVAVPLLSHVHTRLVHGTTLELSFHLAVRAQVRLLAKHRRSVVASTPMRTLKEGNRSLLLRLNVHQWPTKLEFQTHALAPLPTRSTREAGTDVASTPLVFLNALGPLGLGSAR